MEHATNHDPKQADGFYERITTRLAGADLDKRLLKQASAAIASSAASGIRWYDYFPLGQPPHFDQFVVTGRIDIGDIDRLQNLFKEDLLRRLELFPKGIKNPEFLEVQATFSQRRIG